MRPKEFSVGQRRSAGISGSEFTASMASTLGERLRKHGLEETAADEIALDVLNHVRVEYGGQNIYFPKEQKEKTTARAMEIYTRFTNNELSVAEIAQVYSISLQWAYHTIRTIRTQLKAERETERQTQRKDALADWKRRN